MKAHPILASFNAGEASPLLEGRTDLAKYYALCRLVENWIPLSQGGLTKRPGFRFVAEVRDSSKTMRLLPFEQSNVQAYALELGDLYMRVFRNGGSVTLTAVAIGAVSNANPVQVDCSAVHNLVTGDRVVILGVSTSGTNIGQLINNREFRVTFVDADSVTLQDAQTGANINGAGFAATGAGGTIAKLYEIVTPYAHTDVPKLLSAQSLDVLYVAHPSYRPQKISRTDHTAWTCQEVDFQWPPFQPRNADTASTVFFEDFVGTAATGSNTGVPYDNTRAIIEDDISVTAATNPLRVVVAAGHNLTSGREVYFKNMLGCTQINHRAFQVLVINATTIDLYPNGLLSAGENGTAYPAGTGKMLQCTTLPAYCSQTYFTGVTLNAGSFVLTGVPTGHGIIAADLITIHGVEGTTQMNNQSWTVTSSTANTITVNVAGHPAGAPNTWPVYSTRRYGLVAKTSAFTASARYSSADVGGWIKLTDFLSSNFTNWTPGINIDAAQRAAGPVFRTNAAKLYKGVGARDEAPTTPPSAFFDQFCGGQGGTLALPPIHDDFSREWDTNTATGSNVGIQWLHMGDGTAYLRVGRLVNAGLITVCMDKAHTTNPAVPTSLCRAAGTVVPIVVNNKHRWARSYWSNTRGFPACVTFFEDRLWWASGGTLYASRTGDYETFRQTGDAVSGLSLPLNTDKGNTVSWMSPGTNLIIGTSGGEFVVNASDQNEAVTANNARQTRRAPYGSKLFLQAIRQAGAVLYVSRGGRRLRELVYEYTDDSYKAPDLTLLAEHIAQAGIKWIDSMGEPFRVIWSALEDGKLIGLTYERDQDVVGWHRQPLGGVSPLLKTHCVIPHPDGNQDQLWAITARTISGGSHQYVEYMENPWVRGGVLADAFYVDSGLTYSGASASTLFGLFHLRGETVTILRDGLLHATKVVSATGSVTLDTACTKAQLGFGYNSDVRPMRLDAGAADGTAQGRTKRITRFVSRLFQAGKGLLYGAVLDETKMNEYPLTDGALFDGDTSPKPWPGGYSQEGGMAIRHNKPLPCTLVALFPEIVTSDR